MNEAIICQIDFVIFLLNFSTTFKDKFRFSLPRFVLLLVHLAFEIFLLRGLVILPVAESPRSTLSEPNVHLSTLSGPQRAPDM